MLTGGILFAVGCVLVILGLPIHEMVAAFAGLLALIFFMWG